MTKNVCVSICCVTYNQVSYIVEAIESFLIQKTNFTYEILIHDDCSTDGTTEILKEYEKKYPNLIKVYYEEENQYSKGNINKIFVDLFKNSHGKYIALCEGDDYWCDENKLQKQYEYMEYNSKCSVTVHGCFLLDDYSGRLTKKEQPYKGKRFYSVEEVIRYDGDLFATNSMFFKKDLVIDMPKFYYEAPVVDFPLMIHLSLKGEVYYLDEFLSVYRVNAKGSWTIKQNEASNKNILIKKKEMLNKELAKMMSELNKYTDFKYQEAINLFLINRDYSLNMLSDKMHKIKNAEYRKLYKIFPFKDKIKLFLIRNATFLYKLLFK